jgi:hypothetical protein
LIPFDTCRRYNRASLITFHRTIVSPQDDFSLAMDVELALPSGNIGDEPDACGNTLEGFTCAAPEYAIGKSKKGVVVGGLVFGPVCLLVRKTVEANNEKDQKERKGESIRFVGMGSILGSFRFCAGPGAAETPSLFRLPLPLFRLPLP